jgi:hypothetical protein
MEDHNTGGAMPDMRLVQTEIVATTQAARCMTCVWLRGEGEVGPGVCSCHDMIWSLE